MPNAVEGNIQSWKAAHVYFMAAICLLMGVALGFLFRGSASVGSKPLPAPPASSAAAAPTSAQTQMPSLEDMKQMAAKQAAPLLVQLRLEPNNFFLLNQIGTIYKATHQFKEAADYYQKAVEAEPKNVAARTDLASCLFYEGDADGALSQIRQSLAYAPRDANSLFNLGLIRFKAKNDPTGAVAAWQQLLRSNPSLGADKKAEVEKLIAQARNRPPNR